MIPVPDNNATIAIGKASAIATAIAGPTTQIKAVRGLKVGLALIAFIAPSVLMLDGAIAAEATDPVANAMMVDLSGRWSGTRASRRIGPGDHCKDDGCQLTLDIVACGDAWCGTRVDTNNACAGHAMTLERSNEPGKTRNFKGKFELATGTAPYVIEAWYNAPGTRAGEGSEHAQMSMIGDTGSELRLFRRSFPFEASFERISDAVCKSEKPVS